MQPTSKLCANFGHNFYRENIDGHFSNIVKCKKCSKQIRMNADGDFEDVTNSRTSLEQLLQKLNFLKTRYAFRKRTLAVKL